MLKVTLLAVVAMAGLLGCLNLYAQEDTNDSLANVIQKLDALAGGRDARGLVKFLAEVEDRKWWSLGGGVGPVDSDWLQVRAIGVIYFSTHGTAILANDLPAALNAGPWNRSEQGWVDLLSTPNDDVNTLRRMLGSSRPAVRLLALNKLHMAGEKAIQQMKDELKMIASQDAYVVIERSGTDVLLPSTAPVVRGNAFKSPLRQFAAKLLNLPQVPNGKELGGAAIRRFSAEYVADPARRDDIMAAVRLLRSVDAESAADASAGAVQNGGEIPARDLLLQIAREPQRKAKPQ